MRHMRRVQGQIGVDDSLEAVAMEIQMYENHF